MKKHPSLTEQPGQRGKWANANRVEAACLATEQRGLCRLSGPLLRGFQASTLGLGCCCPILRFLAPGTKQLLVLGSLTCIRPPACGPGHKPPCPNPCSCCLPALPGIQHRCISGHSEQGHIPVPAPLLGRCVSTGAGQPPPHLCGSSDLRSSGSLPFSALSHPTFLSGCPALD